MPLKDKKNNQTRSSLNDNILNYEFYDRSTIKVAKELLGKLLVHRKNGKLLSGIIVETEAYLGKDDPASHASLRKTPRNSVMFERSGLSYVYFIYGNHFCFNVVAHPEKFAGAVLIRALEPVDGIRQMKLNRNKNEIKDLTNGPGKLTQALNINREHNGIDLVKSSLYICDTAGTIIEKDIVKTTRIGISEAKELPLRFYIKNNHFISKK